jgi:hypothetical protein
MKLLSTLILGAALVAFTGNIFAEEKPYVAKDNEEIYGTWVNMDYKPDAVPNQKVIIYPGRFGTFGSAESKTAMVTGSYWITDKWTDSEGNIWYKTEFVEFGKKNYELSKISNSGKTREFVYSSSKYPTKIDPENATYHIYHRK